VELPHLKNYIGGALVDPASGSWLDSHEPATGEVYSRVPDSNSNDVDSAVVAAEEAFKDWASMSTSNRSTILERIADLIDRNVDELSELESRDNGKPVWLAKSVDIPRCSSNFRFFARSIAAFASESHSMPGSVNYTLRKPLGVVACISPWNLPLYLFTWKIAPALAAGNCVVAKPSEVTPMTAYRFSQLCIEAGLPAGVLNVVHGSGHQTGNAIVSHPRIKAISFTGGTKTGAQIARVAAPEFKKLSLELGGKNPNIIFDDCNFEEMLDTTIRSSFANQGQICLCGSRIYVQQGIYERFKKEFVSRTKDLKVGDPKDSDSKLGAIVSHQHFEKILSSIERARQEGGIVLCGGEAVEVAGRCEKGWFIQPTIIEGLTTDCRTNQEEIFGPVVSIQSFDTESEAVDLANSTQYGLSATVWTSDLGRAHRVADQIEAGIVWVNCWLLRDLRTPFGGTKNSGVGREGGNEALRFWTEPKNVCIQY
jgi:aminomuconate-semialdehyde/2-hydroxymuconate-6-semialdehyde dehydrogenase